MLLQDIKKTEDIKKLNIKELENLSQEVRDRIVDVTSRNGGHIASSLGATDLSIALLKVFNPPSDSVVWDVGHQSYAYRILTGKNEEFEHLRQYGGLSGFNNRFESDYDAFGVGHSSTSISAAVGMASAKKLKGDDSYSIAIIGDGALTGGMAFEALNHGGQLDLSKLIVILNDNNMSISKNVGAIQNYLTNVLVSRSYNSLKKQIWDITNSMPHLVRNKFINAARKFEESMINILVPNIIFEDFGFKYVGPVDGNNMQRLVRVLNKIKMNIVGPVVLHVLTKKGKGYSLAEKNASIYHGVGPFDKEKGVQPKKRSKSWSEVFGDKLCSLAVKNKKVCGITAAMSVGTGLSRFEKEYPKRFFDVGIAEQHAVTFAAGLCTQGMKPFISIYSTFIQRAYDQIIHDVALQKLPIVICLDRAGLVGEDGATHHGAFDISFLKPIPNLVLLAPANNLELEAMLEYASTEQERTVVIRYPRGSAIVAEVVEPFVLGKFNCLQRGKRLAILSVGHALGVAKEVVEFIKDSEGLDVELINVRTIKPLDYCYLDKLKEDFELVVTIEHNVISGGVGESIKSYLADYGVNTLTVGYPDKFIKHGNTELLYEEIDFTAEGIVEKIINTIKNNKIQKER